MGYALGRGASEWMKRWTQKVTPLRTVAGLDSDTRVFAIYQILLGWKAYKFYHENDELPNPRPTQPKKK